jgi:hypothetical protein
MQCCNQFHKEDQKEFGFDAVKDCEVQCQRSQFQTDQSFHRVKHRSLTVEIQTVEKVCQSFLL